MTNKTETVGSQGHSCVFADRTLAVLKYHAAHPEATCRQLCKQFGISNQRVCQIIKGDKRDQMVIEYFRRYPRGDTIKVRAIFHISDRRARTLRGDFRG